MLLDSLPEPCDEHKGRKQSAFLWHLLRGLRVALLKTQAFMLAQHLDL